MWISVADTGLGNVILRLSHREIGSFDSERKPFVLFLGPFRGPFFHQGLEWFLSILFLTVLAFTHVSRSLYLGLIGSAENNALPIEICPPSTYTALSTTTAVFRLFPASTWAGFITSDFLAGYGWLWWIQ